MPAAGASRGRACSVQDVTARASDARGGPWRTQDGHHRGDDERQRRPFRRPRTLAQEQHPGEHADDGHRQRRHRRHRHRQRARQREERPVRERAREEDVVEDREPRPRPTVRSAATARTMARGSRAAPSPAASSSRTRPSATAGASTSARARCRAPTTSRRRRSAAPRRASRSRLRMSSCSSNPMPSMPSARPTTLRRDSGSCSSTSEISTLHTGIVNARIDAPSRPAIAARRTAEARSSR